MARVQYNIVGGNYKDINPDVDPQRSVNFYPVIDEQGGNVLSLYPTPGLKAVIDTQHPAKVRRMISSGGYLWAVVGKKVFRIDSSYHSTEVSGTLTSGIGQVFIAANSNGQICVVDSGDNTGYTIDNMSLTKISDADFVSVTSLTYQDGYGIVTEKSTGRFWVSAINDFTSWSALDYGSAEALPDDLLVAFSSHRELWCFGERTIEPFANTGNADFPFERIGSGVSEVGIGAAASVVKLDNSLYWLDQLGNIRVAQGYIPMIVSSPQVSYSISTYGTFSDAIGMGFTENGHAFYALTFPSAKSGHGATWCYDIATRFWHQRSSYPFGTEGRWRPECHELFNGKNLFGDWDNGKIYELDHTLYKDNDEAIHALRVGPEFNANGRRFVIHSFELLIRSGVGIITGQGSDPQIMFRRSKDGGHSWSNERWKSLGAIGEYGMRCKWNQIGSCRSFIPEIKITDPVNRVIKAGYIDLEIGKN